MSKRKRDEQPRRLFREFNQYRVEQFVEVALMLYALQPFPLDNKSEWKWHSLARQAFDFLDNLHKARALIEQQRSAADAAYRRGEKRSAQMQRLPDIVSFGTAILRVTGERWTKRAEQKFKSFVLSMPRYFGKTKRQLHAQIARWRKNGISRDEVIELQIQYDIKVRSDREQREAKRGQAKKRRQPWEKKRVENAVSESAVREVKKQKKVDALLGLVVKAK
jgi:hypothetical protein